MEALSEAPAKKELEQEHGLSHQRRVPNPMGRPVGSMNKATARVRTIAQLLVEDEEYVNMLKIRLKAGDAPHMETLLWHYAYGKPKETVELQGEVNVGKVVREIVIAPQYAVVEDKDASTDATR